MGEAFEMYEDGLIDEMGEAIFYPRYFGRRYKRKRNKKEHNPRKGVINYIHYSYSGKPRIPNCTKIALHFAKEHNIAIDNNVYQNISAVFREKFVPWFNENKTSLYHKF
jgi:hypothetical protein